MAELTKEECDEIRDAGNGPVKRALLDTIESLRTANDDLRTRLEAAELEIGRLCVSGNRIHDGLDEAEQEIKALENALVEAQTEAATQTAQVRQLEDHIRCAPDQDEVDALEARVRELEGALRGLLKQSKQSWMDERRTPEPIRLAERALANNGGTDEG